MEGGAPIGRTGVGTRLSIALRRRVLLRLLTPEQMRRIERGAATPKDRRRRLGLDLSERLDDTVAHGPLRGLRLSSNTSWGEDRASMLLGLYEQEVVERVRRIATPGTRLVNVGAGDGYYAVGCLRAGFAATSVAFEATAEGRQHLAEVAQLNGVADRLEIRGTCTADELLSLDAGPSTLLLMDIEGGEFEVLTADVLEHLRHAHLIIELHEWRADSATGLARILADAERLGFAVDWLRAGARDPGSLAELRDASDDDRWSVCSEGRPEPMRWLCLTPHAG